MELAEDALDAVDLLVEEALVDPARVGLVGFSQGGWIAPLASNRSTNVSFVVTVSGSVATPRNVPSSKSLHLTKLAVTPLPFTRAAPTDFAGEANVRWRSRT